MVTVMSWENNLYYNRKSNNIKEDLIAVDDIVSSTGEEIRNI